MTRVWDYLADPGAIFFAATFKREAKGTPLLVVSSPEETLQEPYVEEPFQEEVLVLFFTTRIGAEKHVEYLVTKCGYDRLMMGLMAGKLDKIFKVLDIINKKMVDDIGRSLRAEVYHMDGDDCVDFDMIFSNWVTKH